MRSKLARHYAHDLYARNLAANSAEVVVPLIVELVKPTSVIDVGCGRGAWLKVFRANGVERIAGLDGDYIDPATLAIPAECFRAADLSGAFEIERGRFDLAVCLEVGEHLQPRFAANLVRQLVAAAPIVVFSAAPPGQPGGGHVNCQPLSYWRALFDGCGFKMLDPLRPQIRDDQRVAWWYRQNVVMFASPEAIAANPALAKYAEVPAGLESEWVHMWVAAAQSAGTATRVRRMTGRVLRRATKSLLAMQAITKLTRTKQP
jgi:SAM-dependent methyltransferase